MISNSMICFPAVIKPILQTSAIDKILYLTNSAFGQELFEKEILLLVFPSLKALELSFCEI